MRFGAKVDNYGAHVEAFGLDEPAIRAEAAGFSSLWLSDHVVMPSIASSPFPFSDDGSMHWEPDDPWFDPIVSMAYLAAITKTVEVAVGILLAVLRPPVVLAKQIATVDALSKGRVVLGVGAGWLAEEFEALGVPFEARGDRLNEWMALCRSCWTGQPLAFSGVYYQLPSGVICLPRPHRPVPMIVGGMSAQALRRAALIGDGWIPLLRPSDDIICVISTGLEVIRETALRANRDLAGWRCIFNAHTPSEVAPLLSHLRDLGVTDVVVDVDYSAPDGPAEALAILQRALR